MNCLCNVNAISILLQSALLEFDQTGKLRSSLTIIQGESISIVYRDISILLSSYRETVFLYFVNNSLHSALAGEVKCDEM